MTKHKPAFRVTLYTHTQPQEHIEFLWLAVPTPEQLFNTIHEELETLQGLYGDDPTCADFLRDRCATLERLKMVAATCNPPETYLRELGREMAASRGRVPDHCPSATWVEEVSLQGVKLGMLYVTVLTALET